MSKKDNAHFYERINKLAGISEKKVDGNKTSELISYNRANSGTALGIIRENHNFFIKVANNKSKEKLDTSDFTYIGGLENKNQYRYKSLAEAEKNLDFKLNSLNESYANGVEIVDRYQYNNANIEKLGKKLGEDSPISKAIREGKESIAKERLKKFKKNHSILTEEEDTKETLNENEVVETDLTNGKNLTSGKIDHKSSVANKTKPKVNATDDDLSTEDSKQDTESSLANLVDDLDQFNSMDQSIAVDEDEEIKEEDADDDIAAAADKLSDIESTEVVDANDDESPVEEPSKEDEPSEEDEPAPDVDVDSSDEPTEEEPSDDEGTIADVKRDLGKLAEKVKNVGDLEPADTKYIINTLLSAMQNDIAALDDADKKKMTAMFKSSESSNEDEEESSSEDNKDKEINDIIDDKIKSLKGESEEDEINECGECGGFHKFMMSRGYNPEDECSSMELGHLISSYANAHDEGMNDGDYQTVASYMSPEVMEEVVDYGHDEYIKKLAPYMGGGSAEAEASVGDGGMGEGKEGIGGVDVAPNMDTDEGEKRDVDGDGDIDSDDYLAARDQAIKKSMKKNEKFAPVAETMGVVGATNEGEEKLRAYIRNQVKKLTSPNKEVIEESEKKKPESLKKLDQLIKSQLGELPTHAKGDGLGFGSQHSY